MRKSCESTKEWFWLGRRSATEHVRVLRGQASHAPPFLGDIPYPWLLLPLFQGGVQHPGLPGCVLDEVGGCRVEGSLDVLK